MASTLTTARAGTGFAAACLALCLAAALFAWAILGGIWIARRKEAAPGEGRNPP